jgi:5'-nucleotidase
MISEATIGLARGSSLNTYSGALLDPLNPDPKMIRINDIAHALSLQCRFTGHVQTFYSVAQHSLAVSLMCPREDRLWGLLHDATEAYLVDLARPLKAAMPSYRAAETTLMRAICLAFDLPPDMPPAVKAIDDRMLFTEARYLLCVHPEWERQWEVKPYPRSVLWPDLRPADVEDLFLRTFHSLR